MAEYLQEIFDETAFQGTNTVRGAGINDASGSMPATRL
jgi:hypothetical protein